MKYTLIAALFGVAITASACSTSDSQSSQQLPIQGRTPSPTIEALPTLKDHSNADPAIGGIWDVQQACTTDGQRISFHIRTEGEGKINVKAETHVSVHSQTLYARTVEVSASSRDQTEVDFHQFDAPKGVGIFIQVAGGGGMNTSQEVTLPPVC